MLQVREKEKPRTASNEIPILFVNTSLINTVVLCHLTTANFCKKKFAI